MQTHRQTETNIIGYRLDRIYADRPDRICYEVTSPDTDAVIARFPDRLSAERFIVMRELGKISTRPHNRAC